MSPPRCFGERWEVVKPIADGGQSHVYEVRDLQQEFEGSLVLKRLRNHERLDRFEREIAAVQRLNHPGIASILAYSLEEPAFFITRHYGLPLTNHAPIPVLQALSIFEAMCNIVAYAHDQGVVHRDLKPDNVLLNEQEQPIVIDFGLAYLEDENRRLTATMEQVGSRFYMAPELEGGRAEDVSSKVDCYALGKILYFMLTGRHIPRESFLGENNIATLLNNAQLGYVNERILTVSVTENPQHRKSALELREEARATRSLIEEHFYPGTVGSKCRFCGEGIYSLMPEYTLRIREPGLEHSITFVVLLCNRCRNVQWFLPLRS